jgi:hypothetical protein
MSQVLPRDICWPLQAPVVAHGVTTRTVVADLPPCMLKPSVELPAVIKQCHCCIRYTECRVKQGSSMSSRNQDPAL